MKYVIEVEDFYLDEDKELEPALKQFIISDIIRQIDASIKTKVEDHVNREVKAQVEQTLYRKISTFVTEAIASDKIKGNYTSDPEMTLQEHIKSKFTKSGNVSSASIDKSIEILAGKFGDEMKKRYDLLFASQLVSKLHENGMLKEDVAKLLLGDK